MKAKFEYTTTSELRFFRKHITQEEGTHFGGYSYGCYVTVLQQKVLDGFGTEVWVDVPTIHEEHEPNK